MKWWYGRHYCCHSPVTEHVGSNKRSVGCREIEFLLPGNKHHIIFIFVLLFLFFCFRKLTNKGTGPRDWRILFLYNYDNYSYITMTIICLFSAASLSRSFSLMRKNWPKKALVRVIGEGFCYYITMTTICFFSVAPFSFLRKNWPKKALVQVIWEGLRWKNTKTQWSLAWEEREGTSL